MESGLELSTGLDTDHLPLGELGASLPFPDLFAFPTEILH